MSPNPVRAPSLDISDSAAAPGDVATAAIHAHLPTGQAVVSFTARIRYDTTVVRYVAQDSSRTGSQGVVNATSGLVRVAGIAPAGFGEAEALASLRFAVLAPGAPSAFTLTIDELHTLFTSNAARIGAAHQP